MTREEQLQFCRLCKNKEMDIHKGIIRVSFSIWQCIERVVMSSVFIVLCFITYGVANCHAKNQSSEELPSLGGILDMQIRLMNSSLPNDLNSEVSLLRIEKQKDKVVYLAQINTIEEEIDSSEREIASELMKETVFCEIVNGSDARAEPFMRLLFNEGYNLCYRYLNTRGILLYEVVITEEEYKDVLNGNISINCNDDGIIDMVIRQMNMSLPDNSTPDLTVLKVEKENDKIVNTQQYNAYVGEMESYQRKMMSKIDKEAIYCAIVNGNDAELKDFLELIFKEGYSWCYRYLNSRGILLYEVVITEEEYKDALNGNVVLNCPE